MASTKNALIARGIDDVLADKISSNGHTLRSLKLEKKPKLLKLGFTEKQVQELFKEKRPPIPQDILFRVLHKSRWTCCVCRNSPKPIVVHHIDPWSNSRDHSENNLVVVCHDCHDAAHTTKSLSQNLNSEILKQAKKTWELEVTGLDQRALQTTSITHGRCWYYFNHLRVIALATENGVDPRKINSYMLLKAQKYIDVAGHPVSQNDEKINLYNYGGGMHVYHYMEDLINTLLGKIDVINVSDYLEPIQIRALARPMDLIFVQGAHYFSSLTTSDKGQGQIRKGHRQVGSVRVEYVFDAWEATSASAWAVWLSGRQSAGSLCHVKSVDNEDGITVVKCTVLAIAFGLREMKTREYMKFRAVPSLV